MIEALSVALRSLISTSHSPVLATFPTLLRPLLVNLLGALGHLETGLFEYLESGTSHTLLLRGLLEQLEFLNDRVARNGDPLDDGVAIDFYNRIEFSCFSAHFLTECVRWKHQTLPQGLHAMESVRNEAASINTYLLRFFGGIQPSTGPMPSDEETNRVDGQTSDTGQAIRRKLEREVNDTRLRPSKVNGEVVWRIRHAMYWLFKARQNVSLIPNIPIASTRSPPPPDYQDTVLESLHALIKASWLADSIPSLPDFEQAAYDLRAYAAYCVKTIFRLWETFTLNFLLIDYNVLSDNLPNMWEISMPGDPKPPSSSVASASSRSPRLGFPYKGPVSNRESEAPLVTSFLKQSASLERCYGFQNSPLPASHESPSKPVDDIAIAHQGQPIYEGLHHSYRYFSIAPAPSDQQPHRGGANLSLISARPLPHKQTPTHPGMINSRSQRATIDVTSDLTEAPLEATNQPSNVDGPVELEASPVATVPYPNLPELANTSHQDPVEIGSSSSTMDVPSASPRAMELPTDEFEVFNFEAATEENPRGTPFIKLLTRESPGHFIQSSIRVFKDNNLTSPQHLRIWAQQAGVEEPLEITVNIKSSELVPAYAFTDGGSEATFFYIRQAEEPQPVSMGRRMNTHDEEERSEFHGLQGIFLGCFPERETFIAHLSLTPKRTSRRNPPNDLVETNVRVQVYTDAPPTFDLNAAASIYSVSHMESAPRDLSSRISQSNINEDALFATRYYFFIKHDIYVLIVSTRYTVAKKSKVGNPEYRLVFRPSAEERIPSLRLAKLKGNLRHPPGIPLDRSGLRYRDQLSANGPFAEFESLELKFSSQRGMNAFYDEHKQYLKQWDRQYQLLKANEYREMFPHIQTSLGSLTRTR